MADYRAMRAAAHASHEARQRKCGGGVSDEAQDKKMVAAAVHKHEAHDHPGEKETKLKRGGHSVEGRADGGRRLDRKGGKGHHTSVNIILGGGQGDQQAAQQAHQAGMQQGVQLGARAAAAKLAGAGGAPGGPPPGMAPPGGAMPPPGGLPPGARPPVAGMGPPPGAPPMMPGRKRGGRALGEKMKYGAGSGEGRLEKEELAEQEMGR